MIHDEALSEKPQDRYTGRGKFNESMEEYVATALTGAEVYGATRQECEERLREANRVWIEHCRKCQEDQDEL